MRVRLIWIFTPKSPFLKSVTGGRGLKNALTRTRAFTQQTIDWARYKIRTKDRLRNSARSDGQAKTIEVLRVDCVKTRTVVGVFFWLLKIRIRSFVTKTVESRTVHRSPLPLVRSSRGRAPRDSVLYLSSVPHHSHQRISPGARYAMSYASRFHATKVRWIFSRPFSTSRRFSKTNSLVQPIWPVSGGAHK